MDESITLEHFREYSVKDLKKYLGQRRIRADGRQGELAVLAYWAWKLKVPVNPSQQETEENSRKRLQEILTGENGQLLPDPEGIAERDWITDVRETPLLTYPDIYHYLINTPGFYTQDSLKSYRALDAYQFVTNGFVQPLRIHHVQSSHYTFVKTSVRRSQSNTDPYEVWVCMNKDDLTIKGARCRCMAGLGEVCSHVGALLFKIVCITDLGVNKQSTCTELPCAWSDFYNEKTKPTEIKDVNFQRSQYGKSRRVVRRTEIPSCSSEDDDDLWDIISEATDSCVAHQLIEPSKARDNDNLVLVSDQYEEIEVFTSEDITTRKPLPVVPMGISEIAKAYMYENPTTTENELFTKIANSVNTVEASIINDKTLQQSSDKEWHRQRQYRVTATKVHAIHKFISRGGKQPCRSIMSAVKGKSTISQTNPPPAIRWGREKEEIAVSRYVESMKTYHQNLLIEKCGLTVRPGDSHIGASPDRLVTCDCCVKRVLECKCPFSAREKSPQKAIGTEITYICETSQGHYQLDSRHQYYTQVQTQMALTGLDLCDFIVYTDHGLIVIPVRFNKPFWEKVKDNINTFYLRHVIPEIINDVTAPRQRRISSPLTALPVNTIPQHRSKSKKRKRLQESMSSNTVSTSPISTTALTPTQTTHVDNQWPCGMCHRSTHDTYAVACDRCDVWFHYNCVGLTDKENLDQVDWYCKKCK